jgi:acylphosphatase
MTHEGFEIRIFTSSSSRSQSGTNVKSGKQENLRAHVIIHGLVQGVYFRASTRDEAVRLGVKGWVRNLSDGSVEALFEGEKKSVEAIVAWCYKGPSGAQVHKVDLAWQTYRGEFGHFDIRYGW